MCLCQLVSGLPRRGLGRRRRCVRNGFVPSAATLYFHTTPSSRIRVLFRVPLRRDISPRAPFRKFLCARHRTDDCLAYKQNCVNLSPQTRHVRGHPEFGRSRRIPLVFRKCYLYGHGHQRQVQGILRDIMDWEYKAFFGQSEPPVRHCLDEPAVHRILVCETNRGTQHGAHRTHHKAVSGRYKVCQSRHFIRRKPNLWAHAQARHHSTLGRIQKRMQLLQIRSMFQEGCVHLDNAKLGTPLLKCRKKSHGE